jgi:hypothetical protein
VAIGCAWLSLGEAAGAEVMANANPGLHLAKDYWGTFSVEPISASAFSLSFSL